MMYQAGSGDEGASLETYLRAVQQRSWYIPASIILCALVAFLGLGARTETFTATARISVGPMPIGGSDDARTASPNLDQEREVLTSDEMAANAILAGNLPLTAVDLLEDADVDFVPSSNVLRVRYTSDDAVLSAAVTNALAAAYTDSRDARSLSFYEGQVAASEELIVELAAERGQLISEQESLAAERAAALVLPATDPSRDGQIALLDDARANVRVELNQQTSANNVAVKALAAAERQLQTRPPAAALLQSADVPTAPDGISATWIYTGAVLLGLGLGIAAAFVAERLDSTVRTREDVGLALNTSVLGTVPLFGIRDRLSSNSLFMLTPGSGARSGQVREAFRRVRTALQFLMTSKKASVVMLTSAFPAEGKSSIVANLAVAMAGGGHQVAVLNADMRRPTLETLLDMGPDSGSKGLSNYLGGDDSVQLIASKQVDGLWLMPAGELPANPGELLSSQRFKDLLDQLREQVDFVLVDSPPVLSTADAAAACPMVDGVVVVVDSRRTELADLLSVRADIELAGGKILGSVLNKTKTRRKLFGARDRYVYNVAAS